jgi:hypothetical protein
MILSPLCDAERFTADLESAIAGCGKLGAGDTHLLKLKIGRRNYSAQ